MQVIYRLDVRTVALFIALTFFVQATAIGAQAFLIRELRQYRGVVAALLSNLSMAVGLILRVFVEQLPAFFTTIPANLLILLGPALFYMALGQFTGLGYSKALISGILMAALVSLSYFTYVENHIGMRTVLVSVGIAVMVFLLIYQLWRTRKTLLRFSANLMLVPFMIYSVFLVIRTINVALNPPQSAFSNTPVQSATYLLSYTLSFFWSTGFILMVSQRLHNDLMEVATIDVLTRIPNRRATQLFLEKEVARAQRQNSQFSVLLIDIDNFKGMNDRWGHAVGDHVLVRTAGIFQTLLRKQDWVGRWGGDEFLMILSGSPYSNAEVVAERVRSRIAAVEYHRGKAAFGITVSIGCTCAKPSEPIDQILKDADNALYRAKGMKNSVS